MKNTVMKKTKMMLVIVPPIPLKNGKMFRDNLLACSITTSEKSPSVTVPQSTFGTQSCWSARSS